MKELLNREQAIKIVGLDAIKRVEAENCEPTNRVGYNGACQGDELTEWSASAQDKNGNMLIAYYYTSNEDDQLMADCDGDGSLINWTVSGYEII